MAGRYTDAITEFQKNIDLAGRRQDYLAFLASAYAASGRRAVAELIVKEMEQHYAEQQTNGSDLAMVFAQLGDKDQAFAWLEKDFAAHSHEIVGLKWFPEFAPLRDDWRYTSILQRMGLPL